LGWLLRIFVVFTMTFFIRHGHFGTHWQASALCVRSCHSLIQLSTLPQPLSSVHCHNHSVKYTATIERAFTTDSRCTLPAF
jgi:hypothetical protein